MYKKHWIILIFTTMLPTYGFEIQTPDFLFDDVKNITHPGFELLNIQTTMRIVSDINLINQINQHRNFGLARSSIIKEKLDSLVSKDIKTIFSYDTHGYLITEENVNQDSLTRTEITNDENGKIVLMTVSTKKEPSTGWTNTSKFEITYNVQGKMDICTESEWKNSAWVPSLKIEYTYDLQNLVKTVEWSEWNNGSFKDMSRYDGYVYDSNGRVVSFEVNLLDENSSDYYKFVKYVYTYSSNGITASTHTYKFNSTDSTWTESTKSESVFDSNGNLISVTDFNSITSKEISKTEYDFENVPIQDLILPSDFSSANRGINKKILKTISYNINNKNNWLATDSTKYYYSDFNTSVLNNKGYASKRPELSIFKSADRITLINNSKIPIKVLFFTLQGRLLKQVTIEKTLGVELSDFISGHYIIKYRSNGHQNTIKYVKE